jgi:Xaa-Pro aminopeptidase
MTLYESVLHNRKKLIDSLEKNTICILIGNDIFPGNEDGTLPYRPSADIIWTTGIEQEETALLLFPHHPELAMREILFLKQVDETFVKWHGKRLSREEAAIISGVNSIYHYHELHTVISACANYAESFTLNRIEHPRSVNTIETSTDKLNQWIIERYPLHRKNRLSPIIGQLRASKNPYELWCMGKACNISGLGFERILSYAEPGISGKQIMAELYHEYLQHDGNWAHYEPIVASGENTCILHYISNENILKDGELLLIDAAASYKHYNADLTRTIPVNGRYTPRQKQVYNAVLHIHKELKQTIRSGIMIKDVQTLCTELTMEQLCKLGLTTTAEIKSIGQAALMNRYAYHNFGHYLGLAVHDSGNIHQPIPENAVITIEPGIYIQDEHIGVRIENNVLVMTDVTLDLMKEIPIEAEEIEDLMSQA